MKFYPGTFVHVENQQQIYSIDIQLIQWKRKIRSSQNISSDVFSCTLADDSGKDIKIEKVGKDPIEIKIYSQHITNSSVCKYFDEKENQWKEVPVKDKEIGKWIICSTTHLTDFAAFEEPQQTIPPSPSPSPEEPASNNHLLWLLMLLLVIPLAIVLVIVVVVMIKKKKSPLRLYRDVELENIV